MYWQFTPFVLPDIISVGLSAWLAFVIWQRRSSPGATALVLLMLSVVVWSLGKVGTLEGSAELNTCLKQEYQRACHALTTAVAGV